jgi:hypothetical protein
VFLLLALPLCSNGSGVFLLVFIPSMFKRLWRVPFGTASAFKRFWRVPSGIASMFERFCHLPSGNASMFKLFWRVPFDIVSVFKRFWRVPSGFTSQSSIREWKVSSSSLETLTNAGMSNL